MSGLADRLYSGGLGLDTSDLLGFAKKKGEWGGRPGWRAHVLVYGKGNLLGLCFARVSES